MHVDSRKARGPWRRGRARCVVFVFLGGYVAASVRVVVGFLDGYVVARVSVSGV